MSKFTPGPWFVEKTNNILFPYDIVTSVATGDLIICHVTANDDPQYDNTPIKDKADAQLLATAPDLLEAAKGAERWIFANLMGYPAPKEWILLRAAISKAEGGGE